jgi:hypothetical protein
MSMRKARRGSMTGMTSCPSLLSTTALESIASAEKQHGRAAGGKATRQVRSAAAAVRTWVAPRVRRDRCNMGVGIPRTALQVQVSSNVSTLSSGTTTGGLV